MNKLVFFYNNNKSKKILYLLIITIQCAKIKNKNIMNGG